MTFVVAEIGVNWDGDFELAEKLILLAKQNGCDAVKFQAFSEELVKKHPQHKRLLKSSINSQNIEQINQISKSVGIEWFCTPMYLNAIEMLEPFVNRFKVRMTDGLNFLENKTNALTKRIIETNKEIIISSNISPKKSIFYQNPQIKWLYVVPKYPCSFSELDFSQINDFNGYSNHCPYIIAPLTATILGSEIIEIHITIDKDQDFIDNAVSFDPQELSSLMNLIKEFNQIKITEK